MSKNLLWIAVDWLAAALIVLTVWIVSYKTPGDGIKQEDSLVADMGKGGWREKFADKFSDAVISEDDFYGSPDVSIRLSYHQSDTGRPGESGSVAYNTNVSYVLADIYVSDITCIQTTFAQGIYGNGFSEKLTGMSERMKSVLSVNGDSYNENYRKNNGTIIRNGMAYRDAQSDTETCVLNWDGTMDIYGPGETDVQRLMEKGAYQSWVFGPSLLDENGKAKSEFIIDGYLKNSHPRTAIGYYEPGHYCLLLVDGRQEDSRGMFLDEMAQVFEDLGCQVAYNLDGGHSSLMIFQNQVASHPYNGKLEAEEISDGIFITEGF